jgi:hypothetical protein
MSSVFRGKAATLQDVRRVCSLGPLNTTDELNQYWVDTDSARSPGFSLRRRIKSQLEDEQDRQILVYGHGGSGKSTELAKLVGELGSNFFPVTFSIREEMNLTAVQAEDILLVLIERLLREVQKIGITLENSVVEPVHRYFADVKKSTSSGRQSSAQAAGEAGAGSGPLASLLKLLVEVKGEIKLSVHSEETVVAALRKRPADLLLQIKIILNAVRQSLPKGQRLLLIVEDLDKLDIASAKRIFIDNVSVLAGITADIIYTVPIFTFHSPDARILRDNFRDCGLAMIKVLNPDGTRAPGFDVVKQIVLCRVEQSVIAEEALDLLIEKSGGVLQHVFEVLRNAALLDDAKPPLTKTNIKSALQAKQNEFWSEITWPIPTPEGRTTPQLYDRLQEYAKKQLRGERNLPLVDEINQILLRSCALVEYNGERWYGVHPLVIDNLKALGRIS